MSAGFTAYYFRQDIYVFIFQYPVFLVHCHMMAIHKESMKSHHENKESLRHGLLD